MAVSDTGRPAANSNLLLTSDSDNQRNIGVELSMRERFERELTLINFFNTRAQQYTGARSFRTPRNLTAGDDHQELGWLSCRDANAGWQL